MLQYYEYQKYTSETIKEAIQEAKNILLPLGAIEAHSDHLPLETDNILVDYYALELAKRTNSLVLPTMVYGSVWSLSDAPGSLNVQQHHLVETVKDVVMSLERQGAKMVTLVSAHFGNIDVCKYAARELYELSNIKVVYMTYPNIKKYLQDFEVLNNHSLYLHADEVETSLMLHVKPDVVDMSKARKGTIDVPLETTYTPTKWSEFSDTFIMGDARKATAEKGAKLFEKILNDAQEIILKEKNKL